MKSLIAYIFIFSLLQQRFKNILHSSDSMHDTSDSLWNLMSFENVSSLLCVITVFAFLNLGIGEFIQCDLVMKGTGLLLSKSMLHWYPI